MVPRSAVKSDAAVETVDGGPIEASPPDDQQDNCDHGNLRYPPQEIAGPNSRPY